MDAEYDYVDRRQVAHRIKIFNSLRLTNDTEIRFK